MKLKAFGVFFGLLGLLLLGFFLVTTPQIKRLNSCLNEANNRLAENINSAQSEKWSKDQVCMNGKPVIESLKLCYENVARDSVFPNRVMENVANIIKPNTLTLAKSIELHNAACLNFPEYQIK